MGKSNTVIMDYVYYEISGEYASFMVTPVYGDAQELMGGLILQISNMFSNSRFAEESIIGKQMVDTLSISFFEPLELQQVSKK
ncbi:hypothetical protein [Cellulosilyticum ruminicola]|uniref:hypothetical protein n=1 Tax=Cellulosilyticum ruminicola TaxID=425254 RepID=UPI0006D1248A|nr:hypothetical protein [Cellulosilyticum ruminicola]